MLPEPKVLTPEQLTSLENTFKHCPELTLPAILKYRQEGDMTVLPTIVYGIIERHIMPDSREALKSATDESRLFEDLGIESLTMLEIVLGIEEALDLRIEDSELRGIRTLGDINRFLSAKIEGKDEEKAEAPADPMVRHFSTEQVLDLLPQAPPFVFIDAAEVDGNRLIASYRIRGDEDFLKGHFKDNPVFPASIVFEALGQAACLWVKNAASTRPEIDTSELLFASMDDARFFRKALPGDKLEFEVVLVNLHPPLAIFSGSVSSGENTVAKVERLVLVCGGHSLAEDEPDTELPVL